MAKNNSVQETYKPVRMAVGKNGLLSADKLANMFMGELKRCLQQCQQEACSDDDSLQLLDTDDDDEMWRLEQLRCIDDRIKLRRHGPAIQMDVMHWPATPQKLFYSVDMVPTIQIPDKDDCIYYVAKPIKGAPSQIAWRRSFSLKEKDRLATLDEDNGCRKQVLRVLKVIRNHETALARLTSYHLKTVLFRKTDELSDPAQWRSDCLGQRLMDVIGQMEKELREGVMPHYFLPDVNLLDGTKVTAVCNMRNRLKHLKNSERKMTKLLSLQS